MDHIGPYTLKDKDRTHIDFMCVNIIDPAIRWFEIVEFLISQLAEHDIPIDIEECKSLHTHKQNRSLT